MKPFNLEEAKAGKPVCTRDGRDVRIIYWDKKGDYPIVALYQTCSHEESREYTIDGKCVFCGPNCSLDIFMKGDEPTLDDYTTIKTYEDACKALGEKAYLNETSREIFDKNGIMQTLIPQHIIALMKLETISCALWGREWQPKPDAEGSECYWFPWFGLFTEEEIEDMREEDRGALLSCGSDSGSVAGFGMLYPAYRSSNAGAYSGFRLCQETEEKAVYFGKQFIELWAEYLRSGRKIGMINCIIPPFIESTGELISPFWLLPVCPTYEVCCSTCEHFEYFTDAGEMSYCTKFSRKGKPGKYCEGYQIRQTLNDMGYKII